LIHPTGLSLDFDLRMIQDRGEWRGRDSCKA
jgi:hypothetical protein